ncbi:nucleoside hydrolase [Spirosoma pollinicola]|uniref:Nucleoside hydrolase n=1 Tax=Spirosoma pollinicola TaxID=2057025 RepID=A0A2K8ZCK5_9BACT|nr:nucleoside hydrolase [Spirosoma pollinicola]
MNESILFDHDGSADDFLSLLLVLSMKHVELIGISITPADCYEESALETTRKLLSLTNRPTIPLGVGQFHGINAFPAHWRAKPQILNALPDLITIETEHSPVPDSKAMIIESLLASSQPVTVLMTGPCSNLVQAIEENPQICSRIKQVIWMGGAVDVGGNVQTYNHDGSAEWNVFWDPISSSKLLTYDLPLILIPLDVTNTVAVDLAFLDRLARQKRTLYTQLAGQFWATTIDSIPAYEYTYFMWDVLATSYLGIPHAFTLESIELSIVAKGASAGRIHRQAGSGQWVQVAKAVDQHAFYDYLFDQLVGVD